MSDIDIAFALGCAGMVGIVAALLWWERHHPAHVDFPCAVKLAFIGGLLSLAGALCFAIAAFLGG